jgi:hypothetical protein
MTPKEKADYEAEDLIDCIHFLNALTITFDIQGNYEKYRDRILLLNLIVKQEIEKL